MSENQGFTPCPPDEAYAAGLKALRHYCGITDQAKVALVSRVIEAAWAAGYPAQEIAMLRSKAKGYDRDHEDDRYDPMG